MEFSAESSRLSLGEMRGACEFHDRALIARFIGLEKRPAVVKLSGELSPMVSSVDLNGGQRGRVHDTTTQVVSVRIRDLAKEQIIYVE